VIAPVPAAALERLARACNFGLDDNAPRLPAGFKAVFNLKVWRH
jgi:hypothetical protein